MAITISTDSAAAQGVLYIPNMPWLPLTGHDLCAALEAAQAAYAERPAPDTSEELARLTAIRDDHAKMRILPMTQGDYQRARQASKAIRGAAKIKGNNFVIEDQLAAEQEFVLELIAKRVTEVFELEAVDNGVRTPIKTGAELVGVLRRMSAGHAMALMEDLHQAIKAISHLEKGLGEASPSQSGS